MNSGERERLNMCVALSLSLRSFQTTEVRREAEERKESGEKEERGEGFAEGPLL